MENLNFQFNMMDATKSSGTGVGSEMQHSYICRYKMYIVDVGQRPTGFLKYWRSRSEAVGMHSDSVNNTGHAIRKKQCKVGIHHTLAGIAFVIP